MAAIDWVCALFLCTTLKMISFISCYARMQANHFSPALACLYHIRLIQCREIFMGSERKNLQISIMLFLSYTKDHSQKIPLYTDHQECYNTFCYVSLLIIKRSQVHRVEFKYHAYFDGVQFLPMGDLLTFRRCTRSCHYMHLQMCLFCGFKLRVLLINGEKHEN